MADVYFDPSALHDLFRSSEVAADLQRRAIQVESEAKRICPVDTGRLRSSLTTALGEDEVSLFADVGSDVEYASFVEFGTRYMAPRNYLRGALQAAQQ